MFQAFLERVGLSPKKEEVSPVGGRTRDRMKARKRVGKKNLKRAKKKVARSARSTSSRSRSRSLSSSSTTTTTTSTTSTTSTTTSVSPPLGRRRRSKRKRYEVAFFLPAMSAAHVPEAKRRQVPTTVLYETPSTIQPSTKQQPSITEPFTRTDRLRRRRKLEIGSDASEASDDLVDDNPLYDYMDMITMERIINPAMSPEGHVMVS